MPIREIHVRGMRPYELFVAELDERVTLILGNNGTGKTTLRAARYYMAQGTSFRGRDRDMISRDSTRTDILQISVDGNERRAALQQNPDDTVKKTFLVEGKTSLRLPAKFRQPVVLFEPDELRLLSSSPVRRTVPTGPRIPRGPCPAANGRAPPASRRSRAAPSC